jgi:protein phosphatase
VILLLALIGGGVYGGYVYTQTKYYVGVTDDGWIAVFRGIPAGVAGFQLSHVDGTPTGVRIENLTPAAQETVRATIVKNSRAEAVAALSALLDPTAGNVVPNCVFVTITLTPSPTLEASPSVQASTSPQAPRSTKATSAPSGSVAATPTATPTPTLTTPPPTLVTTSPSPCIPPGG